MIKYNSIKYYDQKILLKLSNIKVKVDKVLSEQKGTLKKISKVEDSMKNEPDDALLEVNILYYFKIALKSEFTYTNIYNNFLYLCYLVNHKKCSKTAIKY